MNHLDVLEAEAIHVFREVLAELDRPVLLFSGGKDSIVLLQLARKAFRPAALPFPVMHVDTGHNFPEVIEFRDRHVPEVLVASVLVDHDADRFRAICADFRAWAGRLEVEEITCIPLSALQGDNVVERSPAMDWYRGPTLLDFLERAPATAAATGGPLRLPVQYVIRAGEQRAYAGQLAGGTVRVGDEVVVLPSGLASRVSAVEGPGGPLESASAPLSVAVSLEDELDVGRGALICRPRSGRSWRGNSMRRSAGSVSRRVGWAAATCSSTPPAASGCGWRRCAMLDVTTLGGRPGGDSPGLNDIARVSLRGASDLAFDPYRSNRWTGAFVLIGEASARG